MIGIYTIDPSYMYTFGMIVKIYISIILIWKFNPLRMNITCTEYDKELIFNSGVFLLLVTTLGDYIVSLIQIP
jgi:hypothetical protein